MTITKTARKSYRVDISLGVDPLTGKQRRVRHNNISTKRSAQQLENNLKQHYYNGTLLPDKSLTFKQLGNLYFQSYTINHKPTYIRTQRGYYSNHLFPYFKDCLIKKITQTHIREFREHLLTLNLSFNSINKHMILLKKIFDVAVDESLIYTNPCLRIKKLKIIKQKMQFWTTTEYLHFISCIREDEEVHKIFYQTAYLTGMRAGELLALKWSDINLVKQEIHVCKTVSRIDGKMIVTPPKSETSNRVITVNSKLAKMLADWKLAQSKLLPAISTKDLVVFQHKTSHPIRENFGTKKIQRICKRCAVHPIRLHDFRHSHVALLIDNGENITVIKERMGHASITTTIDTYGHLFPNKQREMSDKLDFL
ncbi:site-specific integrase [Listeria seeligeri]|uniref:Site-specific integrase n=2 Tax=Listeria seeligeri TaxID=1640 RepID=A0ABR5EBP9_LISSE|nr:site-specific integrase [Listeria seeligeri]EFS01619.1 phage integrase family site specific recombinase [Listeria seeligeri FSL N1-067]KKD50578.1 hypothetical protein UQ68_01730 [Listeria seeligeri]MBF2481891.1 site-specific integrase [Listeria seeligeri]